MLRHEPEQKVDEQDERSDAHHEFDGCERLATVGNHGQHHGKEDEVANHEAAQHIDEHLGSFVLFVVDGSFLSQFTMFAKSLE